MRPRWRSAPTRPDTLGGGIKFGYPLIGTRFAQLRADRRERQARDVRQQPVRLQGFRRQFRQRVHLRCAAGRVGARHPRQRDHDHARAALTRATSEIAGGDLQYYRLGYNAAVLPSAEPHVHPVPERRHRLWRTAWADKPLPFFKNYYAGGPGSVRGYQPLLARAEGSRSATRSAAAGASSAAPSCCSRCRAPSRTSRCAWRVRRWRAGLRRGREAVVLRDCASPPASAWRGIRRSARCASRSPAR